MTNIIKFPNKFWNPKPKNFYTFIKPARYLAAFVSVTIFVSILTAIFGPATFIVMALIFLFYTMVYLP